MLCLVARVLLFEYSCVRVGVRIGAEPCLHGRCPVDSVVCANDFELVVQSEL